MELKLKQLACQNVATDPKLVCQNVAANPMFMPKRDNRSIQQTTITMYILTIIQQEVIHGIQLFNYPYLRLGWSIMQYSHTCMHYNEQLQTYITPTWNHNHDLPRNKLETLRNLILPFSDSFCLFLVYKQSFNTGINKQSLITRITNNSMNPRSNPWSQLSKLGLFPP